MHLRAILETGIVHALVSMIRQYGAMDVSTATLCMSMLTCFGEAIDLNVSKNSYESSSSEFALLPISLLLRPRGVDTIVKIMEVRIFYEISSSRRQHSQTAVDAQSRSPHDGVVQRSRAPAQDDQAIQRFPRSRNGAWDTHCARIMLDQLPARVVFNQNYANPLTIQSTGP